jgi:hypothetical protein
MRAYRLGLPTYHQGADYGEADTTAVVVDGTQCVHDGVTYYGGGTLEVLKALAEFMVRSGRAVAEPASSESDSEPEPAAKAKTPAKRQVSAGSGRRSPKR